MKGTDAYIVMGGAQNDMNTKKQSFSSTNNAGLIFCVRSKFLTSYLSPYYFLPLGSDTTLHCSRQYPGPHPKVLMEEELQRKLHYYLI